MLKYFKYDHLPDHLQPVSKPFYELASHIDTLCEGSQKQVAFQKLLEAKDAAVRAALR